MGGFVKNPRIGWYILFSGFIIAFLLFIPMNKMVLDLKGEEQKKIELWANAVSNKAQVVKTTQDFYNRVEEVEHTRIQQFIEAYKIIMSQNQDADLSSPELRFYTKIIMDNKTIPVIITDEFNNITLSQNVEIPKGQNVLVGDLYKKFSLNAPYEYEIYGMKFKLYYAESDVYLNLKKILTGITGSFLEEITDNTVFAPVVITDSSKNRILAYGNIDDKQIQSGNVRDIIKDMHNFDNPIKTALLDNGYGYIYYQTNPALMWLRYYPFIYIFIFLLTIILFIKIFQSLRQAEQNSVWAGMSKETAHQLGTPISSLMAWIELLRMNPENEKTCLEMSKDIDKLNLVANRFSQIGSSPELKNQDVVMLINNIVSYLRIRIPKNVEINLDISYSGEIIVPLNQPLMDWTVENLIKNAVDAMEGNGVINIMIEDKEDHVHIDISDTGKGILRTQYKKIFRPGYTTKKRGWGLGLSLVKRIIEEYHNGKIYVKNSVQGQGTTFRIELPKNG